MDTFGGFALQIVTEASKLRLRLPGTGYGKSPRPAISPACWPLHRNPSTTTPEAASPFHTTETFASGINEVSYAFASIDSGSFSGDLPREGALVAGFRD